MVAGHNAQIGGRIQENVGEKSDENEWGGRKKKRRIASSLVSQVKGWSQLQKNKV